MSGQKYKLIRKSMHIQNIQLKENECQTWYSKTPLLGEKLCIRRPVMNDQEVF